MDEKKVMKDFKLAYEELKRVVMKDRCFDYKVNIRRSRPGQKQHRVSVWLTREFDDRPIFEQAKKLKEKAAAVEELLERHPEGIAGSSHIQLLRARAFMIDAFELIGVFDRETGRELIDREGELLGDATRLLEENTEDSTALALVKLSLCLLAAEEHYRRRDYEKASASVDNLWKLIKEHIAIDEISRTLLMLALTEETILKRELPRAKTCVRDESDETRRESVWGGVARKAPEHSEDLLYLLGRLGLTEGKISIRRAHFTRADKSLEQCLRSTSAWCQLKLWKLAQKGHEEFSEEIVHAKNFAMYRTAVAQCYLAFSYYRRGRFRRAITQIIPARFTLERSHWVFSNIFADMIRAGAERRLAGIHNEEHVNEVTEICEKTIKLFDPNLLKGAKVYTPKLPNETGERDSAFLLRACYEISASFYYLAEIKEKQGLEKDMIFYLDEAERYANIILSYINEKKPDNTDFWLANSYHLKAFVAMKRPVYGAKPEGVEFEKSYLKAGEIIEAAVEHARKSKGKWLLTETLTDHAFILNATARYYDARVFNEESVGPNEGAALGRAGWHQLGESNKKTFGDKRARSDKKDEELSTERKLTEKKRELAGKALEQLKEAWKVAEQMALEENLSNQFPISQPSRASGSFGSKEDLKEPRSNFAGPIYLYRAESYTLLGNKPKAVQAYENWLATRSEVEYSRAIVLSEEVGRHVEAIDPTLVFIGEIDGLNFDKQYEKLKDWLLKQAIIKGGSDTKAIDLLGVSKATFYSWKNKMLDKKDPA